MSAAAPARPRARRLLAALAAACAAGLAAQAARAAIPSPEKLAGAVAEANKKAGRGRPLILDVALRSGDGPPTATGTLATHPTGLARLELRGADGLERHLLQGSAYSASHDGVVVASPRPLLPPVFLLQADAGASLRAALASFGVAPGAAALGLSGDRDCYVLGGRAPRAAPGQAQPTVPSLWVEVGSYDVVEMDRADGVRYRFGPTNVFEGVRMPRWIEIESPGEPTLRLEITRVARANAPAAAFGADWLSSAPER